MKDETTTSSSSRWLYLISIISLGLIGFACFFVRLFAIIHFESVIHEYDPYFNFRTTKRLTQYGFEEFWNWFDESSWYPLGRVTGQTLFPGIMTTAYLMHSTLHALGLPIDIRDVCVFTAPIFSAFCAWATYGLTMEVCRGIEWSSSGSSSKAAGSQAAGILAGLFVGLSPSYMSRSMGGGFDNEAIAIFTLVFSFYTFLRAMRKGTMASVLLSVCAYFYMVAAWGGYVFVTNVISGYTLLLIFLNKFNLKYYSVFSAWYVLGTLMCLNIPFVGFAAVTSSEHMISHGVFLLGNVYYIRLLLLEYVISGASLKRIIRYAVGIGGIGFTSLFVCLLSFGKTKWSGRSMTLLDPTYASKYIPIIASVSEHQPPNWSSYFFDLHVAYLFAPIGMWLVWKSTNELTWFVGVYGVFAIYFSGVMVRLMLVLSPAVACLAGIGTSTLLSNTIPGTKLILQDAFSKSTKHSDTKEKQPGDTKDGSGDTQENFKDSQINSKIIKLKNEKQDNSIDNKHSSLYTFGSLFLLLFVCHLLFNYVKHGVWVASTVYAHPSIVLSGQLRDGSRLIQDDFREAYSWISQNTHPDSRLMSWWDYGYQSCYMANRTVLVDNNTWNNTHIATVGLAFSSPEEVAFPIVTMLDVDYVFVVFGGVSRYSGDDINKFLWMVRIGGGVFPFAPREHEYYNAYGQYSVGDSVSPTLKNSLMYRLSYHRFADNALTKGYDVSRRAQIPKLPPLKYFEEVYTTSSWIVRIFRVKKVAERRVFGEEALRNVLIDPPVKS